MTKLLTIIIPTYNNTKGLKYLLNYFKDRPYQVVVINNKISKEKKDFIASLFHCYKDRLSNLPQEKNLGFAGAVNLGAKYATGKWLLILNDDIEFYEKRLNIKSQISNKSKILKYKNIKKDTIQELIKFAEKNYFDAVSPVLRNPDRKIENLGYNLLPIGKIELVKSYKAIKFIKSKQIDGLTAACLLVKTSVFKKLKGFDENFFAYLEDMDFFLRFKKAGYKMGIANVEVLHNHMTTAKTMGNFKARQDMMNWWRLYFKHPDKFKFNLAFMVERLRNVSGYLKASFR